MLLDEVRVTNLALIAETRIEFGPGLNVITGETGTGKTLLLGALRLLRGEAASQGLIGTADDSAVVEARLATGNEDLVLTRRIAGGRSRAYRDGAMVPARALAETLDGVIDIVGQHDHMRLTERAGVLDLLDSALIDQDVRAAYTAAWTHLTELRAQAELLGGDARALQRELEMVRFEADEIASSGFAEGEDATLETTVRRLRNAGSLTEQLEIARALLAEDGAAIALDGAARSLNSAARQDPDVGPLATRAEVLAREVAALCADIGREVAELDADPAHLQAAEERVAMLNGLRRKYGETLDEILQFGTTAAARAAEIEELLERGAGLADELAAAASEVDAAGLELRSARQTAAIAIESGAVLTLVSLGFESPVVEFSFAPRDARASGLDDVDLLFASDEALMPGPIRSTASGGELSRAVLALRLAAGGAATDVVAFDEVDAGIGGRTALEMGKKLAELAASRQVLCVTHLPQVAAFASRHFVVTRQGAVARVAAVTGSLRVQELTRMLSGLPDSEKGREHAEELLAIATG